MLDPGKMAESMRTKLQVETKQAVSHLSEYALQNPNFNQAFVKVECDTLIAQLRVEQRVQERLRKRKAQIECLAVGRKIEQFDFDDEATLLRFGQPPLDLYADMPKEDEFFEPKKCTEEDSVCSLEDY
jgi:hypothetical protein